MSAQKQEKSTIRKYMENRKEYVGEDKFIDWMEEVEIIVIKSINFGLLDLPDELYRDNFDKKVTPLKMADNVIKNYKESVDALF